MDRRTRLIVYYLIIVVSVLSGFVVLYNYGMATWEGRPQPLYRSIEVVVQTVTTVGYGGDAPWSSPQMNYLVSLMALSGLVLIFAALPVLVVPLFEDAFRSSAPSSVGGVEDHVVLCSYGPREGFLSTNSLNATSSTSLSTPTGMPRPTSTRRGIRPCLEIPDRTPRSDAHG